MTALLLILVLVLILMGAPLMLAIGVLAMGMMGLDLFDQGRAIDLKTLSFIPKRMTDQLNRTTLLAIPFFVLSGAIMAQGALAKRMVQIARALTSWMPNGLAVAAVLGCCFFASVSGSSPATVVAVGAIMAPALVRAGYSKGFSVGLLTSAGSLGILIPPSIPMVIYGVVTSTSIEKLFLGGLGAGLVLGSLFTLFVVLWGSRARKKPGEPLDHLTLSGVGEAVVLEDAVAEKGLRPWVEGGLALCMPLAILGSIYGGIATATEAAALSVVYAAAAEIFLRLTWRRDGLATVVKDFYGAIVNPSVMVGAILIIVAFSQVLNFQLAAQQAPDRLAEMMLQGVDPSRAAHDPAQVVKFLVMLNLLLLVIGCLMDIISAILIFVPLILPTAHALGIDPILLGTVVSSRRPLA